MNLLLFTDLDRTSAEEIHVKDQRLSHLIEVHRAQVGDQVRVGEVGGKIGSGEILEINAEIARMKIDLTESPPDKHSVKLILALPRPKMLRRILRTAAELGVCELHLINSYRVEKSYWQSPVLEPEQIQFYLLQGIEQSKDTIVPSVITHKRFKPFVEDEMTELIAGKNALLAHPGEYPMAPYGPSENLVLVIGPEGGFIPYEVEKLQSVGCETVSLGPRILRVENAVNALLGRLL